MRNNSPYRPFAAFLAIVFALFTIGLPVVLDACPMPKASGGMTCALCHEAPPAAGTPVLQSPRCCAPVIAAERTTTAFVQTQRLPEALRAFALAILAPSPAVVPAPALPLVRTFNPSWSPPGRDADLPVLHSSLLI